ncbi:MAG TPA: cyclic nucleotide-binding domain-containing protein [Candidatus Dormibacteraeota bacterium]|nr:cyclic nucleotide-binding domain-containing protein [Candidatus Dormibacteraeota bacterium]
MARDDFLDMLRRVPLFEGLSVKELRAVLKCADEITHRAGSAIVREGGGGAGFHLIVDGEAEVLKDGRVRRRLGAGECFGEIALIDGGPRSATVQALTDVRTLSMSAWDFKPVLLDNPAIARKLLLVLCERIRASERAPAD